MRQMRVSFHKDETESFKDSVEKGIKYLLECTENTIPMIAFQVARNHNASFSYCGFFNEYRFSLISV